MKSNHHSMVFSILTSYAVGSVMKYLPSYMLSWRNLFVSFNTYSIEVLR
jgi:hypothetical protein